MDVQRNFIIIALLLVSVMIWQSWQIDNLSQDLIQDKKQIQQNTYNKLNNKETCNNINNYFITVRTDVLSLRINLYGGDIDQAYLLTYYDSLNSNKPFHLLQTSKEFVYQAQSGLVGKDGPDNSIHGNRPIYNVNQDNYVLEDNQDELIIPLTYVAYNKVIYNKIFILKRGNYSLKIKYDITNLSNHILELSLFGQLKQSIHLIKNTHMNTDFNRFIIHSYRGAAYSTTNDKYRKYSFDDIQNEQLNVSSTQGGWIAMLQQYFATAWIPNTHGKNNFYANYLDNNQVIVGFKSSPINIMPNDKKELTATLWLGPEIQNKMASIAPNLDLVVDYGWLWFISQPLFKLLKLIQCYVGNWGIAIIIITFIVRGITYPLTKAQYVSIAKMRMLQPKLEEIREHYANDKQRQSQEIMMLYKTEKVNPFGGCLPLLIQMPIFLALYYMLSCSIELRHAPFALWIKDLSAQDPYYILPIIMGITMFFIQKISPTTIVDPIQKKIFTFMPVIFTVFFLWFPSGLVLYYIISNLVTIIQQKIIYRNLK